MSRSVLGESWWGRGEALVAGVPWVMRRNCSISPRQLLSVYAGLCAVSLGIGLAFFLHGATLVIGFAVIEVLLVGVALWVFARHVGDRESLVLVGRELDVESVTGTRTTRATLRAEWTTVEPAAGQGSLVELTSQGQRVQVGRFVRPEERTALAREIRYALRRACQSAAGDIHRSEPLSPR